MTFHSEIYDTIIGSKLAALVCTICDCRRGGTEMQLRWPQPR